MTTDTLAQAIAERDAAWSIFIARDNDGSSAARVSGAYTRYTKAAASLRTICSHDRFEERGYGAPVCVVCGESEQ